MDKMKTTTIATKQPIDIEKTLESGQVFRWEKIEDWYYLVIKSNLIAIKQEGPEDIKARSFALSNTELKNVISEYFRLDDDIEHIYKAIATDEQINESVTDVPVSVPPETGIQVLLAIGIKELIALMNSGLVAIS